MNHTIAHVARGIAPTAMIKKTPLGILDAVLLPRGRDGVWQCVSRVPIPAHLAAGTDISDRINRSQE
eukprot:m.465077 g.465077  ORF g.465077 m.465077 type:complete len:67 (-) comp21626_c1_seq14:1020-1220(-)